MTDWLVDWSERKREEARERDEHNPITVCEKLEMKIVSKINEVLRESTSVQREQN